ncbi:hypothetical protein EIP86_007724 [Pleurotus ostreatoroseus]|nr:hypothetical protein EIP86_007724 [Pleurotus ostreatoroseus]
MPLMQRFGFFLFIWLFVHLSRFTVEADYGTTVIIINQSGYIWTKSYSHEYQMSEWDWPDRIGLGTTIEEVWFEYGLGTTSSDDGGEVQYVIEDESGSAFQIQATAPGGNFDLQVNWFGMSTAGDAEGSTISIGFASAGYVYLVISGSVFGGPWFSNTAAPSWMQDMLSTFSSTTLREFCIPGSHDAGMSIIDDSTLAISEDAITQSFSIGGQLAKGARFFDIRPMLKSGTWKTGHYSYSSTLGEYVGATGQSIDSIISDVNAFTAQNSELIMLYLNGGINLDANRGMTGEEWPQLFVELSNINHRVLRDDGGTVDLSQMTLGDFISDGPAVLIIVNATVAADATGWFTLGFFPWATAFPLYNKYSNTDNLNTMTNDQIQKMKQNRPTSDSLPFLLSWTLTQSAADIVGQYSIIDLANYARPSLFSDFSVAISPNTYPNVLFVDNYNDGAITALAIAVNMYYQNSF